MGALPKANLSVEEFLSWSETQQEGRFELSAGQVVAMSPETNRHALTKKRVQDVLTAAVNKSGLECTVFPDGAGVAVDGSTVREPDVSVQCGEVDLDSMVLDNPVIVVEVLSPSSIQIDTGAKREEYFRVASILHYLIVDPFNRLVIHHHRSSGDQDVKMTVVSEGEVQMSPPGLSLSVSEVFGEVDR